MTYLIYNFKERNCWSQIFETEKRDINTLIDKIPEHDKI